MGTAITLRADFTADDLRTLAKASRDARQTRRLLALAAIYDGGARGDAAKIGGVGLQIVRDWVVRFNAEGPDGLVDRQAPGKTPLLTDAQRTALAKAVEAGPKPYLAGGWWTWRNGSGKSSASRSAARPWAGSCAPWASASCRRGRATTARTPRPRPTSKKPPRSAGGDPGAAPSRDRA